MKVIIIAAGMGDRLRPLTNDGPKCLLKVAGETILERKLRIFRQLGLKEIAVVRGYKKEKINLPGLTYFENSDYENNNILHSLFCAKDFMDGEFISSYSDIVYDAKVIEKMLKNPAHVGIIVDIKWKEAYKGRIKHPITEAELVAVDELKRVIRIGKDVVAPGEAYGEFIGLAKFSNTGAQILVKEFERLTNKYGKGKKQSFQNAKEFRKAYLTDMIQELADRGHTVQSIDICGGWTEIDTDEDLERANRFWVKKGVGNGKNKKHR